METEIWKWKYGSEKKSNMVVSNALLTYDCVSYARVTVSKQIVRVGYQDLRL